MKKFICRTVIALCFINISSAQKAAQIVESADLNNFWLAYDKITKVKDSAEQHRILKEFYLDKATPGLKAMAEVRNYTEKEFIDAVRLYPKFWSSIRPNMMKVKSLYPKIDENIRS